MRALLLSVVTVLLSAAYSSVAQRDSTVPPYVKQIVDVFLQCPSSYNLTSMQS